MVLIRNVNATICVDTVLLFSFCLGIGFWSVDFFFLFRFLKGMCGWKVTILRTRETLESLVLYLMVLFKADCFGGYVSIYIKSMFICICFYVAISLVFSCGIKWCVGLAISRFWTHWTTDHNLRNMGVSLVGQFVSLVIWLLTQVSPAVSYIMERLIPCEITL